MDSRDRVNNAREWRVRPAVWGAPRAPDGSETQGFSPLGHAQFVPINCALGAPLEMLEKPTHANVQGVTATRG